MRTEVLVVGGGLGGVAAAHRRRAHDRRARARRPPSRQRGHRLVPHRPASRTAREGYLDIDALAAFCVAARCRPREVRARPALRDAYRDAIALDGIELSWPAAVRRARLSAVNHTWRLCAQPLPSFVMTRTFDIQAPMGVLAARSGSAI